MVSWRKKKKKREKRKKKKYKLMKLFWRSKNKSGGIRSVGIFSIHIIEIYP